MPPKFCVKQKFRRLKSTTACFKAAEFKEDEHSLGQSQFHVSRSPTFGETVVVAMMIEYTSNLMPEYHLYFLPFDMLFALAINLSASLISHVAKIKSIDFKTIFKA